MDGSFIFIIENKYENDCIYSCKKLSLVAAKQSQ